MSEQATRDNLDMLYGNVTDILQDAFRLIAKAQDMAYQGYKKTKAEPKMEAILEDAIEGLGVCVERANRLYLHNSERLEALGGQPR